DIKVEVSAPPDLSPVTADVAQVQELLLNLTANACDAMPNGGTLTLTLANRPFATEDCAANPDAPPGSFVELFVRGTSRGMTPAGRGRRHDAGGPRARLRAVLHDQETGAGRGHGVVGRFRHRQGAQGLDHCSERTRRGHRLPHLSAGGPGATPADCAAGVAR